MLRALIDKVAIGRRYESAAKAHLEHHGLREITRNFTARRGELDLVMDDHGTVVFVEVRYRASNRSATPLETITPAKQRRVVLAAQAFLLRHPALANRPCRFDAVGLEGPPGAVHITWIKGAFTA